MRSYDSRCHTPPYAALQRPILILRAIEGLFAADDLLLPADVVQQMLQDIPQAQRVNMPACNHYTIVFRDSEVCDQALRDSLYCKVFVLWEVFAIDGGHVSAC